MKMTKGKKAKKIKQEKYRSEEQTEIIRFIRILWLFSKNVPLFNFVIQ